THPRILSNHERKGGRLVISSSVGHDVAIVWAAVNNEHNAHFYDVVQLDRLAELSKLGLLVLVPAMMVIEQHIGQSAFPFWSQDDTSVLDADTCTPVGSGCEVRDFFIDLVSTVATLTGASTEVGRTAGGTSHGQGGCGRRAPLGVDRIAQEAYHRERGQARCNSTP
ncbi:MAG: hypothetical protein ACE5F1_11270, partial [Planctomycetota bacterium]